MIGDLTEAQPTRDDVTDIDVTDIDSTDTDTTDTDTTDTDRVADETTGREDGDPDDNESVAPQAPRATLYGDAAYGTGELQSFLEDVNIESRLKTQPPSGKGGLFAKDRFEINLDEDTVTCPAKITVTINRLKDRTGIAKFGTN